MADWAYLFTKNGNFPAPQAEISALGAMIEDGEPAYLLLTDRPDPPMKSASIGEEVALCTRPVPPALVAHGVAVIGTKARLFEETPPSVRGLYGPLRNRFFVELSSVDLAPEAPFLHPNLDPKRFGSGQAYVKRLQETVRWHPSTSRTNESLLPLPSIPRCVLRPRTPPSQRICVLGLDPTAGTWESAMTRGPKPMPSFALAVEPDGAVHPLPNPLAWHEDNASFWSRANELSVSRTCIDGPCDTNGLYLRSDTRGWIPNNLGSKRTAEAELAALGIKLYWTTRATLDGFDGASRWIARSLTLFRAPAAATHSAIETHPHGAFVLLCRQLAPGYALPPKKTPNGRAIRLGLLRAFVSELREQDLPDADAMDAACAALMAAIHTLGLTSSFGKRSEGGLIWMPATEWSA